MKKILPALVLPPVGPVLLAMIGLLMARRWRRWGAALTWVSLIALLVLALPVTARGLIGLISVPVIDESQARSAQAIVILGGGQREGTAEYGDTLSEFSLERVRYGAVLAKRLQLPVLVSGGSVFSGQPEGAVMAQTLNDSFGTQVKWIEGRSRDTRQNAEFSAAMLLPAGIRRIVLVTHEMHERRSIAEFKHAGFDVVPAPVSSVSPVVGPLISELPGASALRNSNMALHEIIGYLVLGGRG